MPSSEKASCSGPSRQRIPVMRPDVDLERPQLQVHQSQTTECTDFASVNDGSPHNSQSTTDKISIESMKRNLLSQPDWLGTLAQKSLKIDFTPVKERESIGRQKQLGIERRRRSCNHFANSIHIEAHNVATIDRSQASAPLTLLEMRRRVGSLGDPDEGYWAPFRDLNPSCGNASISAPTEFNTYPQKHELSGCDNECDTRTISPQEVVENCNTSLPSLDNLRGFSSFDEIQRFRAAQEANQQMCDLNRETEHSSEVVHHHLNTITKRVHPPFNTDPGADMSLGEYLPTAEPRTIRSSGYTANLFPVDIESDSERMALSSESLLLNTEDHADLDINTDGSAIRQALLKRNLKSRYQASTIVSASSWQIASQPTAFKHQSTTMSGQRKRPRLGTLMETYSPRLSTTQLLGRRLVKTDHTTHLPWTSSPFQPRDRMQARRSPASPSSDMHEPAIILPSSGSCLTQSSIGHFQRTLDSIKSDLTMDAYNEGHVYAKTSPRSCPHLGTEYAFTSRITVNNDYCNARYRLRTSPIPIAGPSHTGF